VIYCFQQQSNIFSSQLKCSRPDVLHYNESEDTIHWLLETANHTTVIFAVLNSNVCTLHGKGSTCWGQF